MIIKTEHENNNCKDCSAYPLCPPLDFINGDLLFIKYKAELNCSNAIVFGFGHFCTCPGRIQYYKYHRK